MVTLVGTHERVMDQVFSLCLVAREYHRVAAQWPQQSDHVKAAAAVHAPYTELEAVLIPDSAFLSAALNHLCGSLGRRVCCGGHAGAGDRASASKPKRATSLSFDLVELSCSLESFPFTLGVTSRLPLVEVTHHGGHGCAMKQDRDKHNEGQRAPQQVGRLEQALLEGI
jgi:hypothetical protein